MREEKIEYVNSKTNQIDGIVGARFPQPNATTSYRNSIEGLFLVAPERFWEHDNKTYSNRNRNSVARATQGSYGLVLVERFERLRAHLSEEFVFTNSPVPCKRAGLQISVMTNDNNNADSEIGPVAQVVEVEAQVITS